MSVSDLKTMIVPLHEHELITVKDGGIIRQVDEMRRQWGRCRDWLEVGDA